MTRGQELSLPMIAVGIVLLWFAYLGPSAKGQQYKVKT
jgi:prolipoprotein diacylglyceryltransferase